MTLSGREPPGATPLDDLSGLKPKGLTTRAQLNALEAENIRKATLKYLAARPSKKSARFDVKWAKRLHREMFGDVWEWAGALRDSETNLGAPPRLIEQQLHGLLEDLKVWAASGMMLVEQSARLHHRAVEIHPFKNGNGRWSRMLANIWLRLHDGSPIVWPEEVIGAKSAIRGEYLEAIRSADRGEYGPLIGMHERYGGEK